MAANTTMGGGENDSKASDDWAEGSFGKALQLIAVTHCKDVGPVVAPVLLLPEKTQVLAQNF